MVNPDSVASGFHRHIIPVVYIIISGCLLVPLPQFIETDISNDNIFRSIDVECTVLYRISLCGKNSQIAHSLHG